MLKNKLHYMKVWMTKPSMPQGASLGSYIYIGMCRIKKL